MITSVRQSGNKTRWKIHTGRPCWREIWWWTQRQPSHRASLPMCSGHRRLETQQWYEHLSCTSDQPVLSVQHHLLPRQDCVATKYCLGGWGRTIPSLAKHLCLHRQALLSRHGKTTCERVSFFWLSTFLAVKLDSKNNLLLSELLPALMHRADVSAGTKDEDYSRGANFEHISTWAAPEMPVSLHEIFPPFAFSPCQFHCCDHIHKRERCFSVPVTASALGGRAVAASQNPSFKRHRQTGGDKLCGSTGSGATVLHFGPEGRKLSRELPPPAARTSSYASCCRKV